MTYTRITSKIPLSSWYQGKTHDKIEALIQKTLIDNLAVEQKEEFLHPSLQHIHSPHLLKDIQESVDLLLYHIDRNSNLLVVGDYDVDGLTATAIIARFMRRMGYNNFHTFIPNRFTEGYSISEKTLPKILQFKPDLVITVDNGITAADEIEILKEKGIDVIITDHHVPLPGKIPQCLIINPKQQECSYPDKNLAGVGVAFLFIIAIRKTLRERGFWNKTRPEPNLAEELDLVALGTLADQVPLHGVNRVFVHFGLEQIKKYSTGQSRPVFPYLKIFFQEELVDDVTAETLAFQLIPRLNASGRMKDASESLNYLLAEKDEEAYATYQRLEEFNQERRKKSWKMLERAFEMLESLSEKKKGIVLFDESFHEGILGIVASKIVEKYHLPTVLFSEIGDELRGSCRSLPDANMLGILSDCSSSLLRFGGHFSAAGCTLPKGEFAAFQEKFEEACSHHVPGDSEKETQADMEVSPWMISDTLLDYLNILEPYGYENQKPVFLFRDFELPQSRIIGEKHLKWKFAPKLEMIYWNGLGNSPEGVNPCDIAFTLRENRFSGYKSTQMVVKAISPSKKAG